MERTPCGAGALPWHHVSAEVSSSLRHDHLKLKVPSWIFGSRVSVASRISTEPCATLRLVPPDITACNGELSASMYPYTFLRNVSSPSGYTSRETQYTPADKVCPGIYFCILSSAENTTSPISPLEYLYTVHLDFISLTVLHLILTLPDNRYGLCRFVCIAVEPEEPVDCSLTSGD